MQIVIENNSIKPVYQQIIDQIKRDIALRTLRIDQKLPTVRDMAADLLINPNTIAKAYRQLEKDGIIYTRSGAGTFVAEISSDKTKSACKKVISDKIQDVVVEAIHMGIDNKTFNQWFQEQLTKFSF